VGVAVKHFRFKYCVYISGKHNDCHIGCVLLVRRIAQYFLKSLHAMIVLSFSVARLQVLCFFENYAD